MFSCINHDQIGITSTMRSKLTNSRLQWNKVLRIKFAGIDGRWVSTLLMTTCLVLQSGNISLDRSNSRQLHSHEVNKDIIRWRLYTGTKWIFPEIAVFSWWNPTRSRICPCWLYNHPNDPLHFVFFYILISQAFTNLIEDGSHRLVDCYSVPAGYHGKRCGYPGHYSCCVDASNHPSMRGTYSSHSSHLILSPSWH